MLKASLVCIFLLILVVNGHGSRRRGQLRQTGRRSPWRNMGFDRIRNYFNQHQRNNHQNSGQREDKPKAKGAENVWRRLCSGRNATRNAYGLLNGIFTPGYYNSASSNPNRDVTYTWTNVKEEKPMVKPEEPPTAEVAQPQERDPIAFIRLCEGKLSLGERLFENLGYSDENGDKRITDVEVSEDFNTNYDSNKDGCVSLDEFLIRWNALKLSKEFAYQVVKDMTKGQKVGKQCLFRTTELQGANTSLSELEYLNRNLGSLITMCKSKLELLSHNCDCAQLPYTCSMDAAFRDNELCVDYIEWIKDQEIE